MYKMQLNCILIFFALHSHLSTAIQNDPYLFMISIWHDVEEHVCGGVLITLSAVLTAAHCVDLPQFELHHTVKAGMHQTVVVYQERYIEEAIKSPMYKKGNKSDEHDIAVVKTCDPFIQSPQVQPISFLPAHIGYPHAGQVLKMTGWGETSPNQNPIALQEGEFRVMSLNDCKAHMLPVLNVTSAYICTAQPDRSSCPFDSGSPLFTIIGGRPYIYGINSAGNKVCQSEGLNLGIFSNVNYYKPWIQQNLR